MNTYLYFIGKSKFLSFIAMKKTPSSSRETSIFSLLKLLMNFMCSFHFALCLLQLFDHHLLS